MSTVLQRTATAGLSIGPETTSGTVTWELEFTALMSTSAMPPDCFTFWKSAGSSVASALTSIEAGFFKQCLPASTRVLEPAHFTHSPYIEGEMDRELAGLMQDWNLALDSSKPTGDTLAAPAP